ncbi:pantetheine-phosphate adenylyltransferase family protein-like protein [Xylogone sp. PMI_703]|nr:pantetheine-phosphate adenylyltransferase family protein-like protein [Xylogone sp. PMI_703]
MSESLPSLLLLPRPPAPVTSTALKAAYHPSINAAIAALKRLQRTTRLTIAVPCPKLYGKLGGPRSAIYDEVQELLRQLYSLTCLVCAEQHVEMELGISKIIDVHILIIDYDTPSLEEINPRVVGPLVDITTFAVSRRRWNFIFTVDGEDGQGILANYLKFTNMKSPALQGTRQLIAGGVSIIQKEDKVASTIQYSGQSHHIVAVGGTFDHIHAGHRLLLTATALILQPLPSSGNITPRRLIVGITGDELLKNKKHAEYLQSWQQRQNDVLSFLLSILYFSGNQADGIQTTILDEPGPNGKAIYTTLKDAQLTIECVEIQDPYGPTITDESITALVVSAETRTGGKGVNDKRAEKGWHALEVFEVDILDTLGEDNEATKNGDFTSKISSTEIRKRLAESTLSSSL